MANTFRAIDDEVAAGRMSSRKAAKAQVAAARSRAHAARRRVRAARFGRTGPKGRTARARCEKQPTPFVIGLVLVTLAGIAAIAGFALSRSSGERSYPSAVFSSGDTIDIYNTYAPPASLQTDRPMLIVNDHPSDPHRAQEMAHRIAEAYEDYGWVAVEPDTLVEARVRSMIPSPASPMSPRLRDLLDELNYGGVIYFGASEADPELINLSWIGSPSEYEAAQVLKTLSVRTHH